MAGTPDTVNLSSVCSPTHDQPCNPVPAGRVLLAYDWTRTPRTKRNCFITSCLVFLLASLIHEQGDRSAVPTSYIAWEVIIRRRETVKLDRFARWFAIAIGFIVASGLLYMALTKAQWLLDGYTTRNFSITERLLTEGRVLWFYIGLMIFPRLGSFALHHDNIVLSTGLFYPWTTMPALLGLAGMALLAWRTRLKAPLLSFGITWFLIGHGLESTMLSLELAHEHRNYLPSIGLVFVAAWALARMIEYSGWKKTFAITLAMGMTASFAITTALRAHQFGDELRRTQIEAEYHPKSMRTYEAG